MNMRKILQGKLGFGTAPLGNMYRNIPEEEAIATVDAAGKAASVTLMQLLLRSWLSRDAPW